MPCVVLPPGYILLECEDGVVLGFNPSSGFGRYATWQVDWTGHGVHTGHYMQTLDRAVEDWKDRIRRA